MKKFNKCFFSGAGILMLLTGLSGQALAIQQGDWMIRFGYASVKPNDSSGTLSGAPTVGVSVDDGSSAFVNFTYMFEDNLGFEILAALPFSHDINATGALSGKVAEVKHLPPTFSLQYHFSPESDVRLYVGAGINYTTFMDEDATAVISSISLDDSWGLAAQVGVDIDISSEWFFNVDLRYIKIDTTATTDLGTVDVTIDPTVLSIGVGTTF